MIKACLKGAFQITFAPGHASAMCKGGDIRSQTLCNDSGAEADRSGSPGT